MSIIRKIAKTLGRKSTLFNWNEQIRIRIFLFFAVFPFVSGLGQNTPEEFIKKGKFHQEYGQWSDAIKDYTDALAEKAAEMVFKYLRQSFNDPTKESREKMHNASTMAGMAFTNAFLGIDHAMAHKIGAKFHTVHGETVAILLPYVIKYNGVKTPTKFTSFPKYEYYIAEHKYAEIARRLNLPAYTDEEGVYSLVNAVRQLNDDLQIPRSFKDLGIPEKEFLDILDSLADEVYSDQCTTANPRLPLVEEIKQLLLDAYYGNPLYE